jgi:hypothetical protein
MDLGWRYLIPISLAWMLLVAGFMVSLAWGFALAAVGLAGSLLLTRAFDLGRERSDGDEAILPAVGRRPLPGYVLRQITDGKADA